jgi:hypothetical protein
LAAFQGLRDTEAWLRAQLDVVARAREHLIAAGACEDRVENKFK